MKTELVVFLLNWLAANAPQLVELLKALQPVLMICAVIYALYLVQKR